MPRSAGLIILTAVACLGAGCSGKPLQDRHYYSRLVVEGDQIWFDATVTPEYPMRSDAAEETRRGWLAQWLRIREVCAQGHEVTDRRRLGPEDDNPYRHDLRYTVVCR